MKCPNCKDGNRGAPVHISFIKGHETKTDEELRAVYEALSKCDVCDGTGEVSEEKAEWIKQGRRFKELRLGRSYGLRAASQRLGMSGSELSDMERGKVKPDFSLLDKLPEWVPG